MAIEVLRDLQRGTQSAFETPTPVTARLTDVLGTDDSIVFRGGVPYLASQEALSAVSGNGVDYVRLSGDQAFSTTSLADVTGMTLALAANTDYKIELIGSFASADTTTGIALALNVGGTVNRVAGQAYHPINASGGSAVIGQSANGVAVGISSGVPTANTPTALHGNWIVSMGAAGGAAQLRVRSEISARAVTMQAGLNMRSHVIWTASAPAALTAGDWTAAATATAGEISFNLAALPADGGAAITALEYRVGAGEAIAFAGTGTGVRVVTAGLTAGVAVDLQVRAVNAVGAGAWSDVKNRTPLAAGGGTLAIVQAPAPVEQAWGQQAQQTLAAVGSGNSIVAVVHTATAAGVPTITDSAGGTWGVAVRTFVGASMTTRYFIRNSVTDAPTWVRATIAADNGFHINCYEVSGAGAGLVEDAFGSGAQTASATWDMAFTSTVANALLISMMSVENTNTPTGTAPLTVATSTGGYQVWGRGIFPTAGANTATVTLSTGYAGERSFLALKGS